ncbi:hypothetical protein Pla110_45830 [Polystyrenella longa]|uniref:Glycosyltransferase RgtA/B/C/D-like domain-containing protein n=1 Tax=Polystyrenella longa TaxID=2528007 RepID=A0A518CUA6_9PLAN|nr:hypothetical protein [Polystyrenella longa]QDU82820.1 hypothetical protein Pla110_45830 [Polystyrenella longa]
MSTDSADITWCICLGLLLQGLTLYYCSKNDRLNRWRFLLHISAFLWIAMVFLKRFYIDQILPPRDAISHEMWARHVAECLAHQDFDNLTHILGIGNRGYRLVLGAFYWLTDAPQTATYAVHASLAYWGLLSMVDLYSQHFRASRIPFVVIALSVFCPSALFWTVGNIKEGAALWGICMTTRFTYMYLSKRKRKIQFLTILGAGTIAFFRPQMAVLWIVGLAGGTIKKDVKPGMIVVSLVGVVVTFYLIQMVAPAVVDKIVKNGLLETAQEEYELRASIGNSAINFRNGVPTPFISGGILLLTRPWPNEVHNISSLFAGVETWFVFVILCYQWIRCPDRKMVLMHPLTMSLLGALFCFSFYFSFMYNMGLMVRQRLMVYPAILGLVAIPAFARVMKEDWMQRQAAEKKRNAVAQLHSVAAKKSESDSEVADVETSRQNARDRRSA